MERLAGQCRHLRRTHPVTPSGEGCYECVARGDTWTHLRLCLTCGHVGCDDASANRHATGHFLATGHPITCSMEPGESWRWCYIDRKVV